MQRSLNKEQKFSSPDILPLRTHSVGAGRSDEVVVVLVREDVVEVVSLVFVFVAL